MNSRFQDHTGIPTREIPDPVVSEPSESVQTLPEPSPGLPMRYRRHFITGELELVPYSSESGRLTIYAGDKSVEKVLPRRNYDRVLKPLSIAPEQATPERVAQENADARRHGTGAVYDRHGQCHVATRGQQNREMRRKGRQNNDAGFGDYAGR